MKIERRIIDDLKTERVDVAPALPAYLRAIPVLFYSVVIGGLALTAVLLLQLQNYSRAQAKWKAETIQRQQDLAEVKAGREAVEKQARRANEVVAWIEGSRNIQPLLVTMIRSIDTGSSIVDLGLARDPTTPTQIKLSLKLTTQGTRQLDTMLEKIAEQSFRSYYPSQTQAHGEIDYEATLIYQTARAPEASNPVSASSPIPLPAPK
jgi:hypothetical protein